jgi:hypothetical protein
MAANIFTTDHYHAIITCINSLNANAHRKWGTMSAPEMIKHCSIQLQMGLNQIPFTGYEGSALLKTTLGQYIALYLAPWRLGVTSPYAMNIKANNISVHEIEVEKNTLLDLLEQVQQVSILEPHPLLGKLNKKNWGRLIWKHLNHHLKQFNV